VKHLLVKKLKFLVFFLLLDLVLWHGMSLLPAMFVVTYNHSFLCFTVVFLSIDVELIVS